MSVTEGFSTMQVMRAPAMSRWELIRVPGASLFMHTAKASMHEAYTEEAGTAERGVDTPCT